MDFLTSFLAGLDLPDPDDLLIALRDAYIDLDRDLAKAWLPVGIFNLVAGLILCLFGWKVRQALIFLVWALMGALIGALLTLGDPVGMLVAAIIFGLLGLLFDVIARFFLGAAVFGLLSLIMMATGELPPGLSTFGAASVLGGVLFVWLDKVIFKIWSAFAGAYMLAYTGPAFAWQGTGLGPFQTWITLNRILLDIAVTGSLDALARRQDILTIALIVFLIAAPLGLWMQFRRPAHRRAAQRPAAAGPAPRRPSPAPRAVPPPIPPPIPSPAQTRASPVPRSGHRRGPWGT